MQRVLLFAGFCTAALCISDRAEAATITLAPASAVMVGGANCQTSQVEGGVTGNSCGLVFPVQIESGKTLNSVTFYYFDDSGSQRLYGALIRIPLTTTGVAEFLGTFDDKTILAGAVQSSTLSPNTVLSSGYAYFVYAYANYGTYFRGIKLSYI